ncbi:MAG: hypothetical protein COB20_06695 [SAR86 cluster bacterium]|uniref:Cupin type-1 domain-containing protein n=1 Tax=SAR86 cluster bacterium TaxID=2030880 RepID=A0A2A4X7H7_9GAMM|nr:MAG: hypothetical protein COB20_06695 [SAR86 cluster bacterium]
MIIKPLEVLLGSVILGMFAAGSFAQDASTATFVPKSEIMTALDAITNLPDQQVRVVDIGGDINVAVGILRREPTHTDEGEDVSGLVHHKVTEVYYVVSGSGVLVTGSETSGGREVPAETEIVRELVGPTAFRTILNGQTMTIAAGDVIVIPAGIAHGFRHIEEQVTYLSIRVDPDQVLPTGYVHPNID